MWGFDVETEHRLSPLQRPHGEGASFVSQAPGPKGAPPALFFSPAVLPTRFLTITLPQTGMEVPAVAAVEKEPRPLFSCLPLT